MNLERGESTKLFENWRKSMLIRETGAGYDQIDIQACTARGIKVSNVPTAVDDATADANMFLILGALRGFNLCNMLHPIYHSLRKIANMKAKP